MDVDVDVLALRLSQLSLSSQGPLARKRNAKAPTHIARIRARTGGGQNKTRIVLARQLAVGLSGKWQQSQQQLTSRNT